MAESVGGHRENRIGRRLLDLFEKYGLLAPVGNGHASRQCSRAEGSEIRLVADRIAIGNAVVRRSEAHLEFGGVLVPRFFDPHGCSASERIGILGLASGDRGRDEAERKVG